MPVGNYAIMFRWGDGHETGIYTFQYLRSLCPCEECKQHAGEQR
ncbi:MAG TPA: gamma-butyrobetaine hydroxylase-like domain-containing protein [Candidatus Binatia bacterium]